MSILLFLKHLLLGSNRQAWRRFQILSNIHKVIPIRNINKFTSFKGTVRRDFMRVENRLKRPIVINCKTASLYYSIFKGSLSRKKYKTGFSVLTTFTLKLTRRYLFCLLMLSLQIQFTVHIALTPADDSTLQHLYRTIISRCKCLIISRVPSMYGPGLHHTINLLYRAVPYLHQLAQARFYIL